MSRALLATVALGVLGGLLYLGSLAFPVAHAQAATSAASAPYLSAGPPVAPLLLQDSAAETEHAIGITHYGYGDAQSYGIDISNRADNAASPTAGTGANSALVVHQYSDESPAVQIDNTRSQASLRIKNAANETHSAGTNGTGDFIDFWGYSDSVIYPAAPVELGSLTDDLVFTNTDTTRPWTFTTTLTGSYGLKVNGVDFGALVVNTASSGTTLTVNKTGTGAGNALGIINKGTAYSLYVNDGTANVYTLDPDGMPQIGIGNTAAAPTCNSARRGMFWFQGGGAGVKDSVQICAKDAADAYAWRTIY